MRSDGLGNEAERLLLGMRSKGYEPPKGPAHSARRAAKEPWSVCSDRLRMGGLEARLSISLSLWYVSDCVDGVVERERVVGGSSGG